MATSSALPHQLNKGIFSHINALLEHSRSLAERLDELNRFEQFLQRELREYPADVIDRGLDTIHEELLKKLAGSNDNEDKALVNQIIEKLMNFLVEVDMGDVGNRIDRLMILSRQLLGNTSVSWDVLRDTARLHALLIPRQGHFTNESFQKSMDAAVEYMGLKEQSINRRFCGLFLVQELALKMPTMFFPSDYVRRCFSSILQLIRHQNVELRLVAASTLAAMLRVLCEVEAKGAMPAAEDNGSYYVEQVANESINVMKTERDRRQHKDDPILHSSLLMMRELLTFCNKNFESKCIRMGIDDTPSQVLLKPSKSTGWLSSMFQRRASGATWSAQAWPRSMAYDELFVQRRPVDPSVIQSPMCRKAVAKLYENICQLFVPNKFTPAPSKHTLPIHRDLMFIIPRLAAFEPQETRSSLPDDQRPNGNALFKQNHRLDESVTYLLAQTRGRSPELRSIAFKCIGLLAYAVRGDLQPYWSRIYAVIRENLSLKEGRPIERGSFSPDPSVFICLRLISESFGSTPQVQLDLCTIFDQILNCRLTVPLIDLLRDIIQYVPNMGDNLVKGVMEVLRPILLNGQRLEQAEDTTLLAMQMVTQFHFGSKQHARFLENCANNFLPDVSPRVRREAVATCCKLLIDPVSRLNSIELQGRQVTVRSDARQLVMDVLGKLVDVGISDPDQDIRASVLFYLSRPCFLPYLAQPEHLVPLFFTLHDEELEIRSHALTLIGKIADINPAYVPISAQNAFRISLKEANTAVELVRWWEWRSEPKSGLNRNKEQAAKMLGTLAASAPRLMRSYTDALMDVFVAKLKDVNVSREYNLTENVLYSIGELSSVSGLLMQPYQDDILECVIEILQNRKAAGSSRSVTALKCLKSVVLSTGLQPYRSRPEILDHLLDLVRSDGPSELRQEIMAVLGELGALDPLKQGSKLNDPSTPATDILCVTEPKPPEEPLQQIYMSAAELLVSMNPSSLDDFYPAVTVAAIMRIFCDSTKQRMHSVFLTTCERIFKDLDTRAVHYMHLVFPVLIKTIRETPPMSNVFTSHLNSLCMFIKHLRLHIKSCMEEIFSLMMHFWQQPQPPHQHLIELLVSMASALGSEFRPQMCKVVPYLVQILHSNSDEDIRRLLEAIAHNSSLILACDEFLHLIIPPICALLGNPERSCIETVQAALNCLCQFALELDVTDFASVIMHPLIRCLDRCSRSMDDSQKQLRDKGLTLVECMIYQLQRQALIYIPHVDRALGHGDPIHRGYTNAVTMLKECPLKHDEITYIPRPSNAGSVREKDVEVAKYKAHSVDFRKISGAWRVHRPIFRENPAIWLKELYTQMISNANSPVMELCSKQFRLNVSSPEFTRDMFNPAFVSIYSSLSAGDRRTLCTEVEEVLCQCNDTSTTDVAMTILNLAEFMEHCEGLVEGFTGLADVKLLGDHAIDCKAHAKALHYLELQFQDPPGNRELLKICQELISINKQLLQPDAATGVLLWAKKNVQEKQIPASWYEELNEWETAFKAYGDVHQLDDEGDKSVMGRIRCMQALGEWDKIEDEVMNKLDDLTEDADALSRRVELARIGCLAAWRNDHWKEMERHYMHFAPNSFDRLFYSAVLQINKENYREATKTVLRTRELLANEVASLVSESYASAYAAIVNLQLIAQLEQVMHYRLRPETQDTMVSIWDDRISICQPNVDDWQKMLLIRKLVRRPEDDLRVWTKYATLCYKNGLKQRAKRTLVRLLGYRDGTLPANWMEKAPLEVSYAYIKYLWQSEQKVEPVYDLLKTFTDRADQPQQGPSSSNSVLLAKCHLKLGEWFSDQMDLAQYENMHHISEPDTIGIVLAHYNRARQLNPGWYKAWHRWAWINYEKVQYHKNKNEPIKVEGGGAGQQLETYCVHAVEGFLQSIMLSRSSSLQDTLRLLTLWFDNGQIPAVYETLQERLKKVNVNHWLQVIPQLIARIDSSHSQVARLIETVLAEVGKHHPQALVYPLTVATKSQQGRGASIKVLERMKTTSENLVNEASLVSHELIRVAILWHEEWHEVLEEASRMYFGEGRVSDMIDYVIEMLASRYWKLHEKLEKGPETLKEHSFYQAYYKDLSAARAKCEEWKKATRPAGPAEKKCADKKCQCSKCQIINARHQQAAKYMQQAWDFYYHVFKRIIKQLPQFSSLDLEYVSPKLLACRDLELAVPGTYDPTSDVVRIARVSKTFQVITSKQRPRRLSIFGSNGHEYQFLLKGHEDLRQDERVMQLFGLVNSLLRYNPQTLRQNLDIGRYSVIPLSTNSGLIGWLPHCDTLHQLISDYREKKHILLGLEHRCMQLRAPDYDRLTLLQKVEIFEAALDSSSGDDLAKILWLRSPNSETWFHRRTNYTRSLAVMSMVGYVLGLGDRHPSNLMLQRHSGKVIHIDFGDCFEVAMTRDKFPEKIPFRLTRMLTKAMEVTGMDGTFNMTSNRVMAVLRANRDSVLAVLEAFVYDPLLQWRIMDPEAGKAAVRAAATSVPQAGVSSDSDSEPETVDDKQLPELLSTTENKTQGRTQALSVDVINKKAIDILTRVKAKLTGYDFGPEPIDVHGQVENLIEQATSHENLCQCYMGWCPFW